MQLLDTVHGPEDIKKLSNAELDLLCADIRDFLISSVSKTGGHLASNLGVVELTVALHKVFDSPKDSFVFDVGHQCYTHKILTGRKDGFNKLRKEGGISGFPRPEESIHDPFITGHSSTSISAALGIAEANRIKGEDGYAVAIIGDGSMTGGLAFEGLNNAGRTKDRLVVLLNDNKMSISRNVGSMPRLLSKLRARRQYIKFKNVVERGAQRIPVIGGAVRNILFNIKMFFKHILIKPNMFEDMGFYYIGPIDGHNLPDVIEALEASKEVKGPVLVHFRTVKGKGYHFAEKKPGNYHGVAAFDIDTGMDWDTVPGRSFSGEFGDIMCGLAETHPNLCVVTAAMAEGTGLSRFRNEYKNRFFDVGIAEQHAVTFCGGLAKKGMLPVFAVYSSFLQRGYDQIIHDLAIQNLDVILAVDRAGIVGDDGETHQGIFDVAFLSSIPGVTVYCPCTYGELRAVLTKLSKGGCGVAAVRYPRGGELLLSSDVSLSELYISEAAAVYGAKTNKTLAIGYGRSFANVLKAAPAGVNIMKLGIVTPVSDDIIEMISKYKQVFFFEEGIESGGVAEHIGARLLQAGYSGEYEITAINGEFVPQNDTDTALELLSLSKAKIAEKLNTAIKSRETA